MLECEDAVMMLSRNLSTLCLCKAVCKVIRFAPTFGNVEYVKVRQGGQELIA